MKFYCKTCKQETPHTDRIKTSGFITGQDKVCKRCASVNRDPNWRFVPKTSYGVPVYTTVDEALRLYKKRGVKHPERLFPDYQGEQIISLEAFVQKMRDERWPQAHFHLDTPEGRKGVKLIWLGTFIGDDAPQGSFLFFPKGATHWGQVTQVEFSGSVDETCIQLIKLIAPDGQICVTELTGIITALKY